MRIAPAILAALLLAGLARAAPPIDPAHAFSWQENCGWMNFIAGPAAPGTTTNTQSVVIARTYIAGWIWGENIGWVNLGAPPLNPPNAPRHTNASSDDFGVNRNPATGLLSGFAWSENAGWINFDGGSLASSPNPARLDAGASRFRGYAWGENIGWINFDDADLYVGILCPSDFNHDHQTSVQDIFAFLDAWFARDPRADINNDGAANVQDIFDFLSTWFAGC